MIVLFLITFYIILMPLIYRYSLILKRQGKERISSIQFSKLILSTNGEWLELAGDNGLLEYLVSSYYLFKRGPITQLTT